MKSALFSVLCEIKERTVLSLRNIQVGQLVFVSKTSKTERDRDGERKRGGRGKEG
jgi:hypothetical protein